ncbi:MAG TPA: hypothetical protein DCY13_19460 [Verrucomicrobiales bacterium]|nr:hypothetical protein [Verrucomicrobiales bacterium]
MTVHFRTNITEEFGRNGKVASREMKVYRITSGESRRDTELLTIDGRKPTVEELEKDRERLKRKRSRESGEETPDRSRQIDAFITLELLSRYLFEVQGREVINGRPNLIVTFKPGPGERDSDRLVDRVLDRIGGIIWIDEAEYELTRADIRLREKLNIWGGLLAQLEQLHLQILRTREPDGRWRDQLTEARFVGRAVARRINVRTIDLSSPEETLEEKPQIAAD